MHDDEPRARHLGQRYRPMRRFALEGLGPRDGMIAEPGPAERDQALRGAPDAGVVFRMDHHGRALGRAASITASIRVSDTAKPS